MTTYKTVRAFAPASISCFFKAYKHKNPRWAGSYGVGFTVDGGVVATVSRNSPSHKIFFNNKPINFPTVRSVLAVLGVQPLKVELQSELPLGCGFGLSGASALATAYAVNKLLGLKKTNKELAIFAHTAEVENKTGLGDVTNQYYGGFFLKARPSSHFIVERLPIEHTYVYCKVFSKLLTKAILTDKSLHKTINEAADAAILTTKQLLTGKQTILLRDIITIAKKFVVGSRLLRHKKTQETIKQIEKKGGSASMIILGNTVYSDIPFPGAIKLKIVSKGAHLL